ncbi:MAG: transposase [Gammaproteobacteria bacterium]|nr:transposase [Gammaproteobacteria bacterium]
MDGKGRWLDNVFVERLWRSVKNEEVYLKAYDSVADARQSLENTLRTTTRKDAINHLTDRRRTAFTTHSLPGRRHDPRKHLSNCPIYGVHF